MCTKTEMLKAGMAIALVASAVRPAGSQSGSPNLSALKAQMRVFEAVVDETMSQTFAFPFGLLEKTQGTYLPGFGLAFSLEVNLYPMRSPNPFDPRPLTTAELDRAQKTSRERIVTVKEIVPRLLADHAISLRDLGPEDHLAVVVHLFEVNPGDTASPSQLVIETKKSDLDAFWDKKISYPQLLAKIKILEL
jgi:hypothetical protein